MTTPEIRSAQLFAQAIRAEQALLSASGKAPDILEAARLARCRIERAKSEREIADAQRRIAMSRNAQASGPARPVPAASAVGVVAQRGHLSATPKAPRTLASIATTFGFSIGLGRLDAASRAIAERFAAENPRVRVI
jgi:hypothetical protein